MIKNIKFEEISRFKSVCAKEHVSLKDNGAQWFAYYEDNILAGFSGIVVKGKTARVKGTYVFPEFRRKGISKILNDLALSIAKASVVSEITAFTTPINTKWFLDNGFSIKRTSHQGISFVSRRLDNEGI